jgi:hypothetical protein
VTLYDWLYPKKARRTTLLHEIPDSDSEDDIPCEVPSVPADPNKFLEEKLGDRRLLDLILDLDKYKVTQNKELRALFGVGYLVNHKISTEVMVNIKADTEWSPVLLSQDVFCLMDLVKRIYKQQAGDKIGSITDELENIFQLPSNLFAKFKGAIDELLDNLTLHLAMEVENQKKVRWLLRGVDHEIFQEVKKKYHITSIYPSYQVVCSEFQNYEDALKVDDQERVKYQMAVHNQMMAPSDSVPSLLAPFRLPTNDKGTYGDYKLPHCVHCAARTGNFYNNHTSDACGRKIKDTSVKGLAALSVAASANAPSYDVLLAHCRETTISREECEAQF